MKHNIYTRARIRLSVAALAYEVYNTPVMSDQEYDQLSLFVHKTRHMTTHNPIMDRFFFTKFTPHTGLWIHQHPQPEGLRNILRNVFLLTTENHHDIQHERGTPYENTRRSPPRARGRYK